MERWKELVKVQRPPPACCYHLLRGVETQLGCTAVEILPYAEIESHVEGFIVFVVTR